MNLDILTKNQISPKSRLIENTSTLGEPVISY
jgi:hypothetical protein